MIHTCSYQYSNNGSLTFPYDLMAEDQLCRSPMPLGGYDHSDHNPDGRDTCHYA